jgi:hypothetical protein
MQPWELSPVASVGTRDSSAAMRALDTKIKESEMCTSPL